MPGRSNKDVSTIGSLDICCGLSVREWEQGQDSFGAQKHVVDLYHNQLELQCTAAQPHSAQLPLTGAWGCICFSPTIVFV